MLCRFDPASILILDRLDQVLARLDHSPKNLTGSSLVTETPRADSAPHVPATAGISLSQEQDYDQLRIPSSQTTPDAILAWPIFMHRWPDNFITDPLFDAELSDRQTEEAISHPNVRSQTSSVDEGRIPALIQNFLRHVHIKNPVVDAEALNLHAHYVSKEGIQWDAESCLVVGPA